MLNLVRPYHKVTLQFLGNELSLSDSEIESLLVDMILDNRINAQIDQTTDYVIIKNNNSNNERHEALIKWADSLYNSTNNFSNKLV